MQAYSPHIPVGAQHYYKNSYDALRTILKSDGFFGLWRGVSTAILRTAMVSLFSLFHSRPSLMISGLKGSSVQLPSYNLSKYYLVSSAGMPADSFWTFLAASSVSGVCVCIAMQPPDTVRPCNIAWL